MHILYSAGLFLALLVTLPYWLVKMVTTGKYREGLSERLGMVPQRLVQTPARGCIWIHAVSVGEVLAIGKLVKELQGRYPQRRVLISTTTATGQRLARERHGDSNVFFFPLDFAFAIRPYLRTLQPALIILAETEFWPNFLRLAKSEGAQVVVVNGRISDRSYPRYLRLHAMWRRLLAKVDGFLTQTETDAKRLIDIGAPPERVGVAGNLKFDVQAPAAQPVVEALRAGFARSSVSDVIVCGSTVEGEEELVLDAFRAVLKHRRRATLILAPRHPERFDAVASLLMSGSLSFIRRSRMSGNESFNGAVLLLDTIGELAAMYALATVAFVGGSLVPRGGHNILEPAQFGVATMVGPHTENFRDIIQIFRRANAVRVAAPENFAAELAQLLEDAPSRQQLGARAAEVFRSQAGATERTMAAIASILGREESAA